MAELIAAATDGDISRVVGLLKTGADPDGTNNHSETALFWAACFGHSDVCYVLLKHGATVDTSNACGLTALHAAADSGHAGCIRVLIGSGADPNSRNTNLSTPLHLAAYRGNGDVCKLLLASGSSLGVLNNCGKSPVQEAESQGHHAVVQEIGKWLELQRHLQDSGKGQTREAEHLCTGTRDRHAHLTTTFTEPIHRLDSGLSSYRNFSLSLPPAASPAPAQTVTCRRAPSEQNDTDSTDDVNSRETYSQGVNSCETFNEHSEKRVTGNAPPTQCRYKTGSVTTSRENVTKARNVSENLNEKRSRTRDSDQYAIELKEAKCNVKKLSRRVVVLEEYIETLQMELVRWMEKSGDLERENTTLRLTLGRPQRSPP